MDKYYEHIEVQPDTSFVRHVTIDLKEKETAYQYPVFYDAELEKIENIQVFYKKGRKYRPVEKVVVKEQDIELEYIASKKIRHILVPPEYEVKITYNVVCEELMYFSGLHFFSNHSIDSLEFKLDVPKSFKFKHNFLNKESLDYFSMDSIVAQNHTSWMFKSVPLKTEPDFLSYFGIYRNDKNPLIRAIVIPAQYDTALNYMNDWYLTRVNSKKGLNTVAIDKIDKLTKGMTDPKLISKTLYDYVHSNFKYVAIEIGMGAFIPSNANEVFINKEGDCKDLSNFLSEALNYKGVDSKLALAATYHHISDCDFPSLSSANHVVCVAYIDGKPIILDPTDSVHYPESPVESLQDRTILIVDQQGGEFFKVGRFSNQDNLINYQIDLAVSPDDMSLNGDFKANFHGISGNFLRREFQYIHENEILEKGSKHFESVFGNHEIDSIQIVEAAKNFKIKGALSVKGRIFEDGNQRILIIDFLPTLLESKDAEKLIDGTHLGTNFDKEVELNIELDQPIESFEPIVHKFKEEGVSLDVVIKTLTDKTIQYKYRFGSDYISVNKNNLDILNKTINSFNNTINEPIILKTKV